MNSSKRVKISEMVTQKDKNVIKGDNSYEERICDDLSEVILQYLSLEDKLRLECVSQQFRRTLFEKHYFIQFPRKMEKMSHKSIEIFVKKFHKLSKINLLYYNQRLNQMVIQCLIKNDTQLRKIHFNGNKFNERQMSKVFEKYGSNMVSIDICFPYLSQLLNIEELVVRRIPDLSNVHFNSLKRLEILEFSEEDINTFELLIEDNSNGLKHLKIWDLPSNEMKRKRVLNLITRIKSLVGLELVTNIVSNFNTFGLGFLFNDKRYDTNLTKIGENCNQLKRLSIEYKIDGNKSFADLFASLKKFKGLKRLEINIWVNSTLYKDMNSKIDLSFGKTFDAFQELTHLKLKFYFLLSLSFNNNLLKDIERNLPKLQSIIISSPYLVFNCSESTINSLSRLLNLKVIAFNVETESEKHEIESKLKEKCKRITKIDIKVCEALKEWEKFKHFL